MDALTERATTAAGVASPAVIVATFATGAALDPGYDWPTEAFSVIGGAGEPAATVFNAGVSLGGLLALAFAYRLWTEFHPVVGALYGLGGLAFVVAGVFPVGTSLHEVAALVFLVAPLLPIAAGLVDWRAGRRRPALAQDALAIVAIAVWLPYDLGIEAAQVGYGGAELVAVLVLGVWSVWAAARLWDGGLAAGVESEAAPS